MEQMSGCSLCGRLRLPPGVPRRENPKRLRPTRKIIPVRPPAPAA